MNPLLGWGLAALLAAAAWRSYGGQGLLFALSVIVFWLLLQFSRSMRVMRAASGAPVGHVDNAVMLNAKLKQRMTMLQILQQTGSLGRKLSDAPETWIWSDDGQSSVTLVFERGRLQSWKLERPAEPPPAP